MRRREGADGVRSCHGVSSHWGFFQVTGHSLRRALLEEMHWEQARLLRLPFNAKKKAGLLSAARAIRRRRGSGSSRVRMHYMS
ncbi:hypothetical protein QYE76_009732 [Lolium multiflorum]|uniref:Non-haem dioxygenase N-terminal domain-containing protein n=1 Tax=Lolium multiflorum TaxID=4521 RepID=A0AAD8X2D4_LOLMU|nr:hypothetical protein QYE76_009732 [Lolium multiflorum]